MKAQSMTIRLEGLKIYAYHGVLPQENKVGAMYTIDLGLTTNFLKASLADDLNHTINYAEVYQLVKVEMQQPSKLLEHVIYRISQHLFDEFPSIEAIHIALYKENPPMEAECHRVGVEANYTR